MGVIVGPRVAMIKVDKVGILVGVRVPIRVGVLVGIRVTVPVGAAVRVSRSRTVKVAVPSRVRVWVGMGVKVLLGVNVGVAETRGVCVGVDEAVLVGMVWVGKGPSSAFAVPARAVLMPLRFPEEPLPRPNALDPPNVITNATMMNPMNNPA
jgi:hypothetical protein